MPLAFMQEDLLVGYCFIIYLSHLRHLMKKSKFVGCPGSQKIKIAVGLFQTNSSSHNGLGSELINPK